MAKGIEVVMDTKRELERVKGQIENEALTFEWDGGDQRLRLEPSKIRYYTNPSIRMGKLGLGSIDLQGGSVLTEAQLIGTVAVKTAEGLVVRRSGKEITRLDFS